MSNVVMVVIGNIGTVYTGDSVSEGRREFNECIELSKAPFGRGSGEDVTLFIDGMIDSEFTGSRSLAGVEEGGEIYDTNGVDCLTREQVIDVLENQLCVACYDDEPTGLLKECLIEHIEGGNDPEVILP